MMTNVDEKLWEYDNQNKFVDKLNSLYFIMNNIIKSILLVQPVAVYLI